MYENPLLTKKYFVKKMLNNSTIELVKDALDNGMKYRDIQELFGVSMGSISRIKNGKIKPNRPNNGEDIYTIEDIEKLRNELNLKDRKIKSLENQLKLLDWTREKYSEYKNLYENLLIEFEKLQKASKSSQNDFRGTQRNIPYVSPSNSFIEPSKAFKNESNSNNDYSNDHYMNFFEEED